MIVDTNLRVKDQTNSFAAGDITGVPVSSPWTSILLLNISRITSTKIICDSHLTNVSMFLQFCISQYTFDLFCRTKVLIPRVGNTLLCRSSREIFCAEPVMIFTVRAKDNKLSKLQFFVSNAGGATGKRRMLWCCSPLPRSLPTFLVCSKPKP